MDEGRRRSARCMRTSARPLGHDAISTDPVRSNLPGYHHSCDLQARSGASPDERGAPSHVPGTPLSPPRSGSLRSASPCQGVTKWAGLGVSVTRLDRHQGHRAAEAASTRRRSVRLATTASFLPTVGWPSGPAALVLFLNLYRGPVRTTNDRRVPHPHSLEHATTDLLCRAIFPSHHEFAVLLRKIFRFQDQGEYPARPRRAGKDARLGRNDDGTVDQNRMLQHQRDELIVGPFGVVDPSSS